MQLAGVRVATAQRIGPVIGVPQFDGRNPYPIFLDFLDETLDALADRTLLILIDEYELMEAKVDEGKLSPDLFTFLAGLMDNKERLALIFTGSRRLEERDKKYWRELLRRSLFRKVGFLSENDAAAIDHRARCRASCLWARGCCRRFPPHRRPAILRSGHLSKHRRLHE